MNKSSNFHLFSSVVGINHPKIKTDVFCSWTASMSRWKCNGMLTPGNINDGFIFRLSIEVIVWVVPFRPRGRMQNRKDQFFPVINTKSFKVFWSDFFCQSFILELELGAGLVTKREQNWVGILSHLCWIMVDVKPALASHLKCYVGVLWHKR